MHTILDNRQLRQCTSAGYYSVTDLWCPYFGCGPWWRWWPKILAATQLADPLHHHPHGPTCALLTETNLRVLHSFSEFMTFWLCEATAIEIALNATCHTNTEAEHVASMNWPYLRPSLHYGPWTLCASLWVLGAISNRYTQHTSTHTHTIFNCHDKIFYK